MDPVFRPKDACEFLKISHSTLYRLVGSGEIAAPRHLSARRVGWRLSELEKYLDQLWSPETQKHLAELAKGARP